MGAWVMLYLELPNRYINCRTRRPSLLRSVLFLSRWLAQAIGKWWLLYEFGVDNMDDKEACIAAYLRHNEHIQATVPQERLLIWQAKDGWLPLCK